MKSIKLTLTGLIIIVISVLTINYFALQRHMNGILSSDDRNSGLRVWVHYKYFINPAELKYDLRGISENNSTLDVTRVLLQFAEKTKSKEFKKVYLSYRGEDKFYLNGIYFQKLGEEYSFQNPVYTLRTMPENVHLLDGELAYESWQGGWLGVSTKQMQDLNQFAQDWFLYEVIKEISKK
ncbi:hypothetical protein E2K73_07680 [Acinetobacter sp. RF15A]|uniref:hypothetical protein n=1 Tax=unclassified Acinetobacter TaxID=196816 RepID=UPI001196D760|nr:MULTISPECIES: hypothetical protein [unclassified Acinetobacter]TSH74883.1 hypothetical protein E2K73_07680 [Acinetobacter sp. RF15A]TSI20420.1 hypothetical protein E2K74_03025 [Acinetobacter sp. RF15B]